SGPSHALPALRPGPHPGLRGENQKPESPELDRFLHQPIEARPGRRRGQPEPTCGERLLALGHHARFHAVLVKARELEGGARAPPVGRGHVLARAHTQRLAHVVGLRANDGDMGAAQVVDHDAARSARPGRAHPPNASFTRSTKFLPGLGSFPSWSLASSSRISFSRPLSLVGTTGRRRTSRSPVPPERRGMPLPRRRSTFSGWVPAGTVILA